MSEAAIEVRLPENPPGKFEVERQAFYRLLPSLLTTYRGRYVAIHGEKIIDFGDDQFDVALRVQRRLGSVPIYVHLVTEEPQIDRSGVVRDIQSRGI
ncbi:MAG: hypothetical protein K2X38_17385 [Gemmataceae bacterium]|nr:hypothetical protein [Gemmataceae bacterium]